MAEPDFDKLVFDESDVRPPGGLENEVPCYDLALYDAVGASHKGVLVVTVKVQMLFKDGVSLMGKTVGSPLKWSETEKQDFADEVKSLWVGKWSRKHTLQTEDAAMTEVEVVFDTPIEVDGISMSEHWELDATTQCLLTGRQKCGLGSS